MTLWEIKEALINAMENAVDEETGEIKDFDLLEKLEGDFETKLDDVLSYIKELRSMAKMIDEEKKALDKRKKNKESKADWLENYVDKILSGKEFESARNKVTYRPSKSCEVNLEEFMKNDNCNLYLNYSDPKPNKKAITQAIKDGQTFRGAEIVEHINMQIK